jgi:SAM-dependent methyltransferase
LNADEYGRMFKAEERQWWYAGMRSISFGLLDSVLGRGLPATRPRLLDAGCGTGRNLLLLAERGQAVGVDLSPDALEFCRRRGVTVTRASVLSLPFADSVFDGLISFDVLYHAWVNDDRMATRELVRVLRPGGWLLFRVPALEMLWGAHDEAVHSRHRYTKAEVRALLEASGLEVLRATYCNSFLFPVLLLRRTLDRLLGRQGSDVGFLPAPLEWLFRRILLAEAAWLSLGRNLPVGASVVALARKRG